MWLFYTFTFCFIILIIDGYYQYFLKHNIFNTMVNLSGRVSSLFGSELILGSYLSRLFQLWFNFFLFRKKKSFIILISLLFVLIEILIF